MEDIKDLELTAEENGIEGTVVPEKPKANVAKAEEEPAEDKEPVRQTQRAPQTFSFHRSGFQDQVH